MEKSNASVLEAAAIKYDSESDEAPYVVAYGQGILAESMIAAAKESDVHVIEDADLSHALGKLTIGEEIPEELYEVVAQVLALICRLDNEFESHLGL
ncbi:MAG: EscU/YscU/HrcU family type III secretion system export apparatus switch protein [Eubacteriales bacterium]